MGLPGSATGVLGNPGSEQTFQVCYVLQTLVRLFAPRNPRIQPLLLQLVNQYGPARNRTGYPSHVKRMSYQSTTGPTVSCPFFVMFFPFSAFASAWFQFSFCAPNFSFRKRKSGHRVQAQLSHKISRLFCARRLFQGFAFACFLPNASEKAALGVGRFAFKARIRCFLRIAPRSFVCPRNACLQAPPIPAWPFPLLPSQPEATLQQRGYNCAWLP